MVPWKNGKPLIWDATCPDTLVLSYHLHATSSAGEVTGMAEEKKIRKYRCNPHHHDMLSAVGPPLLEFLKELAARMRRQSASGEERPFQYLMQQLLVAVHKGKCWGTVGGSPSDIFV